MQKVDMRDIGGEVIKDNETYLLKDNAFGKNLILSSTFLRAQQETNGHRHQGQEEVYMFVSGEGEMEIDHRRFIVGAGDVVCINDGEFHKVYNTSDIGLYFVCVFDGGRNH
jgi:mannose-6-phosphate isomerase-like protein (cupin superfamily)